MTLLFLLQQAVPDQPLYLSPGFLVLVAGQLVTAVVAFTRNTAAIAALKENSATKVELAIATTKLAELEKATTHNTGNLQQHLRNTAVHVDPIRDEQRWADLFDRLKRIESKVDHGQG